MNHRSKRRRYFSSNLMAKKKSNLFLKIGIKGFICTCNGNEKQCIRESYNVLNEYADKLYGEEKFNKSEETDEDKNSFADGDVMDEFQKEIDAMKTQTAEKTRRFQALDTNIINCIFIETRLEDPVTLHHEIMSDLFETKQKKVRFLFRIVPIEITCRAFMDDIQKVATTLFDKYFKIDSVTYAIVFNKRHNSSLERDAVIEKLASIVQDINKEHKVNLSNPTVTIIVEVMKNICGLAVVRDYFRFCKYNLHSICGIDAGDAVTGVADTAATKEKSTDDDEAATLE